MIEVRLFGPSREGSRVQGGAYTGARGRKPQQVLWMLALNGDRPLSKTRMAERLWEGDPPASWLSTLEGYVSLLRRSLRGTGQAAVLSSAGAYRIDPEHVSVDVLQFDALAAAAAAAPISAGELLTQALGLVRGPVLDGEPDLLWVMDARTRYDERVCDAATQAARLALGSGDFVAAIGYGKWACELDPFAEDAWQIVIDAQWRAGRRAQALQSFSQLETLLDAQLRVDPSRPLQELYLDVLRDDLMRPSLAG